MSWNVSQCPPIGDRGTPRAIALDMLEPARCYRAKYCNGVTRSLRRAAERGCLFVSLQRFLYPQPSTGLGVGRHREFRGRLLVGGIGRVEADDARLRDLPPWHGGVSTDARGGGEARRRTEASESAIAGHPRGAGPRQRAGRGSGTVRAPRSSESTSVRSWSAPFARGPPSWAAGGVTVEMGSR